MKKIICFTGRMEAPFVRRDFEMLDTDYSVHLVSIPCDKNRLIRYLKIPVYFIKLLYSVSQSNILFSEFASWHSAVGVLFCKLLRKKSIIVVGGYDVANVPELKYGLFANRITKIFPTIVFNYGDVFLPVEKELGFELQRNMGKAIKHVYYLPRGHDFRLFKSDGQERRNMILTVAHVETENRAKLKGLDTFINVAMWFMDYEFVIVGTRGKARDWLLQHAPGNVKIIGHLPHEELVQYYSRAKVYCQLSKREGIPNVLCEAMLCECIPVGTPIPGIKTAMQGIGFYAEYGNEYATQKAIELALSTPKDLGRKARWQIMTNLSDDKRRAGLHWIINEVF